MIAVNLIIVKTNYKIATRGDVLPYPWWRGMTELELTSKTQDPCVDLLPLFGNDRHHIFTDNGASIKEVASQSKHHAQAIFAILRLPQPKPCVSNINTKSM
jgi:hypothetical protein